MTKIKPKIGYRSQPSNVSMGDDWYDIADLNHFWVVHRLRVFHYIARTCKLFRPGLRMADIGCGHGLLQLQLERSYNVLIDGYDLNQTALSNSVAIRHPIYFYDINERHADLKEVYDVIFLFDVIEHLEDPSYFLASVKYHLKPDGILVINVPAEQWLFSRYDEVVGHFRRYTMKSLKRSLETCGFSQITSTYWGLVYIPLLLIRKFVLALQSGATDADIVGSGFKPPSSFLNAVFTALVKYDPIPNKIGGSSILAAYQNSRS